jgi:hypothetical protein
MLAFVWLGYCRFCLYWTGGHGLQFCRWMGGGWLYGHVWNWRVVKHCDAEPAHYGVIRRGERESIEGRLGYGIEEFLVL